jgi:nucleotide-binding universal stress UspA family protein
MYKKILFPTDGSKFSEKAINHVLFIAKNSGAEILALSVIETNFSIGLPADDTINSINKLLRKEAEKNLKEVKELGEVHDSVKISTKIVEGSPADSILEIAEKESIDLIIMGSSGKTGFNRFLIGSVADKVVKNASCAVLVAH